MIDLRTPAIESAVRPLWEDVEMQLAATHLVREMMGSRHEGAEDAIRRWDVADAKRRRPLWPVALWVALILVSAVVGIRNFTEVLTYGKWTHWAANFSFFSPGAYPAPNLDGNYTAQQKLLLFGDQTKSTQSEKKYALWQSAPENIAFYSEYSSAYISDHDRLPPDYWETVRRMDPENAWFTYFAASIEAKDAVKSMGGSRSKKMDGKWEYRPSTWEILDQGRHDRALELIAEASVQPKWDDYSGSLLMQRLSLLPQRNALERLEMINILSSTLMASSFRTRWVANAISAKAWNLGEAGDEAGFQKISTIADHFLQKSFSSEPGILLNELVASSSAMIISGSLAEAAAKLQLPEETARWNEILTGLRERSEARDSREFIVDGKRADPSKVTVGIFGGTIAMVAKQVEHQPLLTDGDLKPARLLDHEILSRMFTYLLWILMAVCMGLVAAYRFRVSKMVRLLARRMEGLLTASDWVWIIGVGVVLPFIFTMSVNRLTPLGGRQFGVVGMELLLPAVHFLGLLFLWLILPVMVVRWRLSKAAGVFGFPKTMRSGWLAVVGLVAFVPAIGWFVVSGVSKDFIKLWADTTVYKDVPLASMVTGILVIWTLSILLSWVIWQASSAVFSRPSGLIFRTTSALIMVRVYAAVLLLLALASMGFKASEQYWFDRDLLGKADASKPGWSRFEYQIALQMRKELREVLGYADD